MFVVFICLRKNTLFPFALSMFNIKDHYNFLCWRHKIGFIYTVNFERK